MKILSSSQIREGDAYTIKHEPIDSIDLMERAGVACFEWIYQNAPKLFPANSEEKNWVFNVYCGVGNNGGDGLVIARLLSRHGYNVNVYIVEFSSNYSKDFEANILRLQKSKCKVVSLKKSNDIIPIEGESLVIDAIFGSGLNKNVEGIASQVIDNINNSGARVISIDFPSGLFNDKSSYSLSNHIIKSSITLTLQFYKISFFLPENQHFVGECKLIDIGIHPDFIKNVACDKYFIQDEDIKTIIKPRSKFAHKGQFGHLLIVAGSYGKFGAACLAAKGALKSGVGLISVLSPKSGMPIIQTSVNEAMYIANVGEDFLEGNADFESFNSIVIGPGIGIEESTQIFVHSILKYSKQPVVIDADALNCLSLNSSWFKDIPVKSVLTPHPGEFKRMVGEWSNDFERLQKQIDFSKQYQVYVVLKGANTSISCPDGTVYINSSGNPGMSTAGCGDVLTGVIGSLLAQGYEPENAAILGVYIHGKAGDIALWDTGFEALTATDLTNCLGKAFLSFTLPTNI